MSQRYHTVRLGDETLLQHDVWDDDVAVPLTEASCKITIMNSSGTRTIDNAPVTDLVNTNRMQYRWTTATAGEYRVEWHAVDTSGNDYYSETILITVDARLAT